MSGDSRQETLRRHAAEALALERDLEAALNRHRRLAAAMSHVAAALERFQAMAGAHREALAAYMDVPADAEGPSSPTVVGAILADGDQAAFGGQPLTRVLRAEHAAFDYAATTYAVLFEVALRLFEPPLRELAPNHLRDYTRAAHEIDGLVADVAAAELADAGLDCHCVCPMCGIGACGCVALGTAAATQAWPDTAPAPTEETGFPLQRPRAGSQLALAGVERGDRLLEIDGERVRTIPEIQTALRKHAIGEQVRLLVQSGSAAPRELAVDHVSDYS